MARHVHVHMHDYGVPGMKKGQRKTQPTASQHFPVTVGTHFAGKKLAPVKYNHAKFMANVHAANRVSAAK